MDMYTWNLCNLLTNATPTHLIRENFKGKMILKVNREKRRIANREYGCSRPSRKKKKNEKEKPKSPQSEFHAQKTPPSGTKAK